MMTKVSDLFTLRYGHSLEFNRLVKSDEQDAVNFVSRTVRNNGVSGRVAPISDLKPEPAGLITVALNGQGGAGVAFVQPFPFYSGYHIMVLEPKRALTEQEKLWWASCITANRFRFGFGRQANKTLAHLTLPPESSLPNWVNASDLDPFKDARSADLTSSTEPLKPSAWKRFRYRDLFLIKKGQRLTKANMTQGATPFIGAIEFNNGYRQFVDVQPNHPGGTISVNYNGSVAEAFYQPDPFWASDDVNVLYPKVPLTAQSALFVCTIIRQERFRYNYGRKWHLDRMNESLIALPARSDGAPDIEFMNRYVRSLPYSSSIETGVLA